MEKQFTPQQARDAFIQLVRIPSVTGKELPAVEYLEGLLDGFGIEHTRIAKTPERPNLLAKLPAEAPCLPPVVLISHIDVVPGDEAQWRHPVFGGEVHGGRIYGRGTLDTKQLTMMELYAFLALRGTRRNRDVYFLVTADEEAGSAFGMEYVKQQRPGLFQNAVVLNEGGGFPLRIHGQEYMTLTIGEKAVCKLRLWAGGQGGHASSPGQNQAIQTLARGIEKVYAAEGEMLFGSRGVQEAMERVLGTTQVDSPVGAQIYAYAGQNSLAMRDYKIGERSNVLPALAETQLECKVLPGASAEEVLAFVKARLAGTGVECELVEYQPGFACDFDGPECRLVVRLLEKACRDAGFACRVLPMLALGRTDGRFFGSEGSRVYGCSPVLAADSFDETLPKVHGKDESIAEASFFFGCRVVRGMVLAACTLGGQP